MPPEKGKDRREDVDAVIADVDRLLSNWKGEPSAPAPLPPPVVVVAKEAPIPPPLPRPSPPPKDAVPPPAAAQPAPGSPSGAKAAEPASGNAPAAPAKPVPEPTGWATAAPDGFSEKRVRKVAIVYCPEAVAEIAKFVLALQAQKSSQNPIFVVPIFVKPYSELDLTAWLEKARSGGAVALLVVAPSPEKRKEVGLALAESKPPARIIGVEELGKRALLVDLVVDLMLYQGAA